MAAVEVSAGSQRRAKLVKGRIPHGRFDGMKLYLYEEYAFKGVVAPEHQVQGRVCHLIFMTSTI